MEGNFNNSCMGAYKDTLDIKITDACNGDCGFCIEKGGKLSNAAPVETFIEKVKSINPKSVLILGGEPFIYPKLAEFIEGISGREIFITTNGSRLKDKNLLKRIAPHLTAINISLMFWGMEKHFNATKVKLKPNDIKEGIEILQEHGVSVRINTILLKGYLDNTEDCITMIEFSKWLGANDIRFSEVQEQPEMFIDAKTIFSGLNNKPYFEGCEQKLNFKGINVFVKQTCGLVNTIKHDGLVPSINNCGGGCRYKKEGVLYPDLVHSPLGWLNKNNSFGCHGRGGGCH